MRREIAIVIGVTSVAHGHVTAEDAILETDVRGIRRVARVPFVTNDENIETRVGCSLRASDKKKTKGRTRSTFR
jgi:hypothetical protein